MSTVPRRPQRVDEPGRLAFERRCWSGSLLGTTALVLLMTTIAAMAESSGRALSVEPSGVDLDGARSRQQLAVTLWSADGSLRDVTGHCRFVVDPQRVASVEPAGVVRPASDGKARVRVFFHNEEAAVDVCVTRASWSRAVSFRTDIAPLLSRAGCNMGACHGNLNGKGGFRLSLRGEEPAFDFQALTHDLSGRRLCRIAPERSLIV